MGAVQKRCTYSATLFPERAELWRCSGTVQRRCSNSAHEELWILFFIFPGEALYRSLYVQRLVQRPRQIWSHLSKRITLLLRPYIYASMTLGQLTEFIIRFYT